MMSDALRAVILGIIEGVTEFLPVSSTGHLLLAERFFDLGEGNFWNSFSILIQLGAILAIVVLYFGKLWRVGGGAVFHPPGPGLLPRLLVGRLSAPPPSRPPPPPPPDPLFYSPSVCLFSVFSR